MKKLLLLFLLIISNNLYSQIECRITYYHPVKEQCNNNPLVTADGSKINLQDLKKGKIKWCGVSRDILHLFPKNKPKRIYIEGLGIYEVHDVMNKRFTKSIDILQHPSSKPITLTKAKITILK